MRTKTLPRLWPTHAKARRTMAGSSSLTGSESMFSFETGDTDLSCAISLTLRRLLTFSSPTSNAPSFRLWFARAVHCRNPKRERGRVVQRKLFELTVNNTKTQRTQPAERTPGYHEHHCGGIGPPLGDVRSYAGPLKCCEKCDPLSMNAQRSSASRVTAMMPVCSTLSESPPGIRGDVLPSEGVAEGSRATNRAPHFRQRICLPDWVRRQRRRHSAIRTGDGKRIRHWFALYRSLVRLMRR